jgi:hypothetical protein
LEGEDADSLVISEILNRAAVEPEFRNALFRNPSQVLSGYAISVERKKTLEAIISDLTS